MPKAKAILTCITAISFCLHLVAQDKIQANYIFANHLWNEGNYNQALKEYLKVYYLDKDNELPEVCDKIADCFLYKNDTENALRYLDLYYFHLRSNESLKNEVRYKKQKIYLLNKDYQKALAEILQVSKKNNADADRYYFLLAVNYLLSDQFDKAKKSFVKLSYSSMLDTTKLNNNLYLLKKNDNKKPGRARWLSAAVPGLGQIVNGEVKDGFNSLGLYLGFIALYIDLSPKIGFGDATLSVGPWLMRYYLGGLNNAVRAAENKKYNKKQNLIKEIILDVENHKNQK